VANQWLTKRCKGLAGSAIFRSSLLLPKYQVNQNSVVQNPLAPEFNRNKIKESEL